VKIVSWNCNGAMRKKFGALEALAADVFIIQECEDPARCKDADYVEWAQNHLWVGPNKNRGLGVFAKPGIKLEAVELDAGALELFLPCRVNDSLALLACWTRAANSPTFGYIGQLWKYLQLHEKFLHTEQSALIGDLNSNACWDVWDRWWNHSDVVKQLDGLGLRSLYHHSREEPQGQESKPTFFMYRRTEKPYHIDYAFLSQQLLQGASMEIGDISLWLQFSDHMPLAIEIAPSTPASTHS
jgi:exonuclease III